MNSEFKRFLSHHGYILGEKIGEGTFGQVYRCSKLRASDSKLDTYAVKVVDLRRLELESKANVSVKLQRLEREIAIMQKLDHPNIVKLHEVLRTREAFFLIMDLVLGVDLFELIISQHGLKQNEVLCAEIFFQLADALSYMHNQNIIHRDIKPENIIVQSNLDDTQPLQKKVIKVKLIDFGLSKLIKESDIEMDTPKGENIPLEASAAKSLVGTPRYLAPEIVSTMQSKMSKKAGNTNMDTSETEEDTYDSAVDVYSMGVLLHVMLGACFPQFDHLENNFKTDDQTVQTFGQNIPSKMSNVVFTDARIMDISEQAKDLLQKLLQHDPIKRCKAKDILSHAWIRTKLPVPSVLDSNEQNQAPNSSKPAVSAKSNPSVGSKRTNSVVAMIESELDFQKENTGDSIGSAELLGTPLNTSSRLLALPNDEGEPETGWNLVKRLQNTDILANQTYTLEDPEELFGLQAQIANYLKFAYNEFLTNPDICPGIVSSAVGSRELMRATQTILRKLEQTCISVLGLLPDLKLAVDEGEYNLAKDFFSNIKSWISTLKTESATLLEKNQQVISVVNKTISLLRSQQQKIKAFDGEQDHVAETSSMESSLSPESANIKPLEEAVRMMQQVDKMLQQQASFWSHMEVVVQVLVQRADHVEGITHFTRNPKLRGRFMQRLQEYGKTWDNIRQMCVAFNVQAGSLAPVLYSFLTDS